MSARRRPRDVGHTVSRHPPRRRRPDRLVSVHGVSSPVRHAGQAPVWRHPDRARHRLDGGALRLPHPRRRARRGRRRGRSRLAEGASGPHARTPVPRHVHASARQPRRHRSRPARHTAEHPGRPAGRKRAPGRIPRRHGRLGLHECPTRLQSEGDQSPGFRADRAPRQILRPRGVLESALPRSNQHLHERCQAEVDRQPWRLGGPLLVRDGSGMLRQVGVTALAADSPTRLYAGFTSVPVERKWIASAIRSLRG